MLFANVGVFVNSLLLLPLGPHPPAYLIRDGETTIKIKFSLFRGGGLGGREENRPKTLLFVGNATTIKF